MRRGSRLHAVLEHVIGVPEDVNESSSEERRHDRYNGTDLARASRSQRRYTVEATRKPSGIDKDSLSCILHERSPERNIARVSNSICPMGNVRS